MPTKTLAEFRLDHARARAAVHAAVEVPAMISGLGDLGLDAFDVASRVRNRKDYLRRPDLGRTLDPDSAQRLASRAGSPCLLAIVLGDGLSPTVVHAHASDLLRSLIGRLAAGRIETDQPVIAS